MESCLGFNVDCGILVKGAGVVLMAFTLFVGSVYLILTAVLGRWMGYLVADGRLLRVDDRALRALGVRLLLAGSGHAREPRAARSGARLGPDPRIDR